MLVPHFLVAEHTNILYLKVSIRHVFYVTDFYESDSGFVYSHSTFLILKHSGDKYPDHHKEKSMKEEQLEKMKEKMSNSGSSRHKILFIIKNE